MTRRQTHLVLWAALALPAALQLGLLAFAVAGRIAYPFDLEWMEGGMLHHAERVGRAGIYVAPSIDFVPYLYTPLYPAVLAGLGSLLGLTYTLGRALSVVSMIVLIGALARAVTAPRGTKPWQSGGAAMLSIGLFAAGYPWMEGWYDLVRGDTMFLAMVFTGLLALPRTTASPGWRGHALTACVAAWIGLSFFAKQTGIFFVATGGAWVLFRNWRHVPVYVFAAGAVGLGGTALLNMTTGGWFWTYVFEVHQTHDFNWDRVVTSFGNILLHFPAMTAVVLTGAVATGFARLANKPRVATTRPFVEWTFVFAAMTVAGAISWGTQWAHFNAYLPALISGAIAAGLGVRQLSAQIHPRAGTATGLALSLQLAATVWNPSIYVPTDADRAAGARLVRRIASFDGDVMVPFHPYYARLAGKQPHAHRMGLMDMSLGKGKWRTTGVGEALRSHKFSAVITDNRDVRRELPGLGSHYRIDNVLSAEFAPRVFSGAGAAWSRHILVPRDVWVPALRLDPPQGATSLDTFEDAKYGGWTTTGRAWGRNPLRKPLPNQGRVAQYSGRYYATSYHGGDSATGTLTSPAFTLTGNLLTFRISGGRSDKLRVALVIDGAEVRSATGMNSERMRQVAWDIRAHHGSRARISIIDNSTEAWGHLNVDEVWLWGAEISDAAP